jgi:hypothetical protein
MVWTMKRQMQYVFEMKAIEMTDDMESDGVLRLVVLTVRLSLVMKMEMTAESCLH